MRIDSHALLQRTFQALDGFMNVPTMFYYMIDDSVGKALRTASQDHVTLMQPPSLV